MQSTLLSPPQHKEASGSVLNCNYKGSQRGQEGEPNSMGVEGSSPGSNEVYSFAGSIGHVMDG